MAKSQPKNASSDSSAAKIAGVSKSSSSAVEQLNLTQPELSNGELGTLQEILFGKQMALHSSQLSSLYSHVEDQLAKLQENCEQQFADLRNQLAEGLSQVNGQVEQIDKKHIAGIAEVNNSLGDATTKLMGQLSQAADNNGKIQGQLETQLNESSERLTQSMQTSREEIMQRLEAAIAELSSQKLDKGALSSLLGDVATQLTGQEK